MIELVEWRRIWERKGAACVPPTRLGLADLIALDGFDHGLGKMREDTFRQRAGQIWEHLGCQEGAAVLEVGCGAGAMLKALEGRAGFTGVDYSASLVRLGARALPQASFLQAEALLLPFPDATFDAAFAHSVFQYFPDLRYADTCLRELARVIRPQGRMVIADVPDLVKLEAAEAARFAGGSLVNGPSHLYYPREFFLGFARRNGMEAKIVPLGLPDYGNSPYRFTVVLHVGHSA